MNINKKYEAAAVIPIKTNNQRLPGKNTKLLVDKPLLNHLFDTLCKNDYLSEVFIDSSDDSILNIAKEYGFSSIKRPTALNSPTTHGNELLNFELEYISQGCNRTVIAELSHDYYKHSRRDLA